MVCQVGGHVEHRRPVRRLVGRCVGVVGQQRSGVRRRELPGQAAATGEEHRPARRGQAQQAGGGRQGHRRPATRGQRGEPLQALHRGAQPVRGDRDQRPDPRRFGQLDRHPGAEGVPGDVVTPGSRVRRGWPGSRRPGWPRSAARYRAGSGSDRSRAGRSRSRRIRRPGSGSPAATRRGTRPDRAAAPTVHRRLSRCTCSGAAGPVVGWLVGGRRFRGDAHGGPSGWCGSRPPPGGRGWCGRKPTWR